MLMLFIVLSCIYIFVILLCAIALVLDHKALKRSERTMDKVDEGLSKILAGFVDLYNRYGWEKPGDKKEEVDCERKD